MKKILIICVCALLLLLCACGNTQTGEEVKVPETTEAAVDTEPAITETKNPFEFESEIDFSDFDTAPETQPTEPEETQTPTQAPTQPQEPQEAAPSMGVDFWMWILVVIMAFCAGCITILLINGIRRK